MFTTFQGIRISLYVYAAKESLYIRCCAPSNQFHVLIDEARAPA